MKIFYKSVLTVPAIFLAAIILAQSPINNVNTSLTGSATATSYTAKGAKGSSFSNTSFQYTFGTATQASNNLKTLNSFTIGSDVYSYEQNANSFVKIRRVNNTEVSGTRTLLWVEKVANAASNKVAVVNQYNDNMESVFSSNTLNQGTDNLFANQGDGNGNNNNIERMDVIFSGGVISTSNTKVGFALFERGEDNAHDPFVIAAITSVDVNGNPTAYGKPVRVKATDYGNLPSSSTDYYVVRKDPATEATLRMSTSGTQNIGGVFISFNDLGVNTGDKIYGYSIIGYDLPANATAANLADYTNSTYFPRNTGSANTQGGIDLIALTGVLSTPETIILPPTAENIVLPALTNTSLITHIEPLEASAASGTIVSYTIQTIPPADQGILYICVDGNCNPVTAGQVLTPEQIGQLSFQPNPTYTGDVVFTYSAMDSYNQVSNTASYTIPLTGSSESTLPLSILSFSANVDKKSVQLNWQTSQEINSSYFEIQRSSDGRTFEPVGTVTAKGNSSFTNTYQSKNDLSLYLGKIVFYRLKMVDIDGKFKYSPVIMLKLNTTASESTLKAWPIPFANELNMDYNSDADQEIEITMRNINGAVILNSSSIVKKGHNVITINQAQSKPSGTYLLTISNGTKSETIKVVKN